MTRIRVKYNFFFSLEISDIKSRLTIAQVLNHYQLHPDRNHMLRCPFHDDKTPSLQIYPKTNTFCCFSSNCQAGSGDVIDFIRLKEGCSKHAAIMKAKQLLGVETNVKTKPNGQRSTPAKTKPPPFEKLFGVLGANLAVSKQGQAYLKERGLSTRGVGYNATSWPQMKHCVIYPLKDKKGRIVGLYGRSVVNDQEKPGGTLPSAVPPGKHYYTKDRQGLYPGCPNPNTEKLILTESIIDAATLLQVAEIHNHYQILACYGTNGLSEEHQQAIGELTGLNEIIFFFDGDAAGREAVAKQSDKLHQLKPELTLNQVNTPDGEDINSLAVNHPGEEAELLTHLLAERQPVILAPEPSHEKKTIGPLASGKPALSAGRFNSDNPYNLTFYTDTAYYAVKGGLRKLARSGWELDSLRVSLLIEPSNQTAPLKKYRQKLDLYEHKQIEKVSKEAADKLDLRADLVEWDRSPGSLSRPAVHFN